MNNPDNLDRVQALAEHLDTLGKRDAAIVVRDVLSSLRVGSWRPDGQLVEFAAEVLHDTTSQLAAVREEISKRITAQQCHDAAAGGGGAVAELLDAALVMAVRLTAPQMHVHRTWPIVGESVVILGALAEIAEMNGPSITSCIGIVRHLDTRRRRARVHWPTHNRWVAVDELVAFRLFERANGGQR